MKNTLALLGLLLLANLLTAQTLTKKFTWKDKTLSSVDIDWVDLDNDSLLDVIMVGKDLQQKLKITTLKNKLDSGFKANPSVLQPITPQSYSLKDIDHDNEIDLVFFGNVNSVAQTLVLTNQNNFQFAKSTKFYPNSAATINTVVDLDNDGREDWLLAGSNFIKIYQATDTLYQLRLDSTNITVESIAARDFNKDGLNDIIVSGLDKNGKPRLQWWVNKGKFKFKSVLIKNPVVGNIETGDFNHDGWFDLVVAGKNAKQLDQINYYRNDSIRFTVKDSIVGIGKSKMLLADLNSDGLADLSFHGINAKAKKFNFITGSVDTTKIKVDTTGLITQRWGDYDRDGDLDLLTVKDSAGYKVVWVYNSKTIGNKAPVKAGVSFAMSTFKKTFIYWQAAIDDKTPTSALTYDVYLTQLSKTPIVNPEFDFSTKRRLLVTHGNQTTNNFAVINNLSDARYTYTIQPIDNAFNGAYTPGGKGSGGGGNCYGGGVVDCLDLKHEYLQACTNETIELKSSGVAYWFSTTKGFLQISSGYSFKALASDTIVSVVPQSTDCSKNNIWVIRVNGASKVEKSTKHVCENSEVKLGIEPGWKNVTWSWGSQVATSDTVVVKPTGLLLVKVTASNLSCTYSKEFTLNVSKPVLTVSNKSLVLRQGESVQLFASGLKKYVWTPATGLDNNQLPNPIATPVKSTTYYLQASDSIGCIKRDTVRIDVTETAFVASLFTPNGDGKNDALKVLGLTYAEDFQFTIFNREGNVVYETKEVSQAATQGWNGSKDGTPQPSGLYYWKVVGRQSDGQPMRLNGKASGSILLVR